MRRSIRVQNSAGVLVLLWRSTLGHGRCIRIHMYYWNVCLWDDRFWQSAGRQKLRIRTYWHIVVTCVRHRTTTVMMSHVGRSENMLPGSTGISNKNFFIAVCQTWASLGCTSTDRINLAIFFDCTRKELIHSCRSPVTWGILIDKSRIGRPYRYETYSIRTD